jgi:hypothetical protein
MMTVLQLVFLLSGLLGFFTFVFLFAEFRRRQSLRKYQESRQERRRQLDLDIAAATAPSASTYRTSHTASRSVSSRPASVHSTPTRHRGYSRQQDDADNSLVVAAMLIHQHDGGHHYGDYSDSCGGGYDGGGGGDCGGCGSGD